MESDPDSLCVNLRSNSYCDYWANEGECLANPLWMHNECCQSCAVSCTDTYVPPLGSPRSCQWYAEVGACTSTLYQWVRDECCHTCMLQEAAPTLMCDDTYDCNCDWDWCHRRALMGTCTSTVNFHGHNSDFMHDNCCATCAIMESDPDSLCVNLRSNSYCDYWANEGECLANPLWMHNECCQSCAVSCTDTYDPGPDQNDFPDCRSIALSTQGFCTATDPFVSHWTNVCCNSCMLIEAARSLVCIDLRDDCAEKASQGDCNSSNNYINEVMSLGCCATCMEPS